LYVPAGQGKVGAVLRSDMAEAAATVLATPNHEGKTYDFTNTKALSYEEIAITIAAVSGRKINYISPTVLEYQSTLSGYGVPVEVIGIFSSFAIAQAQGELDSESQDLVKLLGRQPLSIADFLKQVYGNK
jgi:NAD(P)H dehydrogenase (quinone)